MKEAKMKAKVTFRKLIQDSQEYGSNDEYIISREFFDLEIGGKRHSDLYVDIKQTVGSNFETAPLEVGSPHDYRGPFNYDAFRDAAEKYYRSKVGSQGRGIRTGADATKFRMWNNLYTEDWTVEFEVAGNEETW
jgi:hypothetical protein